MDWVAVGLCADIPAGTVVPRRVAGTDLAIWCSTAGRYHAWGDRCPHRGMRLSHGFVRGERLACIYHGWHYDGDGACSYIPAHPKLKPPSTICVQDHACRQQDETVWVALEPTAADIPRIGSRRPVRSMDVTVAAEDVAGQLGHSLSPLIVIGGAHDLALALQPSTKNTCMLHAFAGVDQDRIKVSRHLEQIRAGMEDKA